MAVVKSRIISRSAICTRSWSRCACMSFIASPHAKLGNDILNGGCRQAATVCTTEQNERVERLTVRDVNAGHLIPEDARTSGPGAAALHRGLVVIGCTQGANRAARHVSPVGTCRAFGPVSTPDRTTKISAF